jgi:hypothetical protein
MRLEARERGGGRRDVRVAILFQNFCRRASGSCVCSSSSSIPLRWQSLSGHRSKRGQLRRNQGDAVAVGGRCKDNEMISSTLLPPN